MRHRASEKFWKFYHLLPREIQAIADRNFKLLKADPRHPSLHFRKAGKFWSARIGIHYRAAAVQNQDDLVWFWIGHHSEYDTLLERK